MCYGSGCFFEGWDGECEKPKGEACPLDDEEDDAPDFWDRIDEAYRKYVNK